MGFNSLIFICNDVMGMIDRDPEGWWTKAKTALDRAGGEPQDFGFGGAANGYQAVLNHHADVQSLVIVGRNYTSVIWTGHRSEGHHEAEQQVEVLKKAAEALGYHLAKNPKKKLLRQILLEEAAVRSHAISRSANWLRFAKSKIEMLKRLVKVEE